MKQTLKENCGRAIGECHNAMTAIYCAMEGTTGTGAPADRPGDACKAALKACHAAADAGFGLYDAAMLAWGKWEKCREAMAKASPEALDSALACDGALRECHKAWHRAYKAAVQAWAHTEED